MDLWKIKHSILLAWVTFRAQYLGVGLRNWSVEDIGDIRQRWLDRSIERNLFMRDKVSALQPDSILDVGASCGNVLSLISQQLPAARIVGIDMNTVAVKNGNRWLREEHLDNVTLQHGSAEGLSLFPDKSFQVVFSSATIMYVKPDDIQDVLHQMVRIASRAVLMLEMNGENIKKYLGEFHPPSNWKRDYRRIFQEIGISNDRISIHPVPESLWQPGGGGGSFIQVMLN